MEFIINGKTYTLEESDVSENWFGYDVYEGDGADPINLGEVAYFGHPPTKEDVEEWLEDFKEIV